MIEMHLSMTKDLDSSVECHGTMKTFGSHVSKDM